MHSLINHFAAFGIVFHLFSHSLPLHQLGSLCVSDCANYFCLIEKGSGCDDFFQGKKKEKRSENTGNQCHCLNEASICVETSESVSEHLLYVHLVC